MDESVTLEKLKKRVQELELVESENKRLKAELKENQEKFRLIVENTAETISILDMNLRFIYVSPTILSLRGFTVEEVIDQTLEQILTPESLNLSMAVFEKEMQLEASGTADPGRVNILELEEYRKDGSIIWVEVSFSFLRDKDRNPVGILTLSRDITKRKQAEVDLQIFKDTVENSSNVIGMATPEGKHFYQNAAFDALFGSIGDNPSSVYVDKAVAEKMFQTIKAGGRWDGEVKMLAKDGSVRDILLRAYANKDSGGHVTGLIGIHTDITERKRAEEESNRLAAVVRHSRELVSLATPDGMMVFLNDAGKKMLGISEDKIAETHILTVMPEHLHEKARKEVFTAIVKNGFWEGDLQYLNLKTGGLIDAHAIAFRIDDPATGEMQFLANVSLDITQRKRMEESLRESVARFKALFNATSDSVILIDPDGTILDLNDNAAQRRDVGKGTMLGRSLFDFLPPEAAAVRREAVERILNERKLVQYEEARGDKHYSVRLFPVMDDMGKVVQVASFSHDITESRLGEEALRASEERFRTMFNEAPMGIALVDSLTGTIYEVNPMFARIVGRTMESLVNIDRMSITHPDDVQEDLDKMAQMNAGQIPGFQMEKRYLHPDGTAVWVHITIAPLKIDSQVWPLHLRMIEDITQRKRTEEERLKLEAQFQQAQKMESVGRLAGGVAHDFNNMLSVIIGFTELAMDKAGSSQPILADLGEIMKAATRSADLTRQLLAFARKQAITPKVLDLNQTVGGMIKMLRRLIGEDIDLIWKPGADLWQVMMDPSQIDQLLANLCVNARDAVADTGKVVIETKNATFDATYCSENPDCLPGEYLRLSVSDNGCGMDKAMLGQIFEPFFTTKEMGAGTGLGLATVYGIVRQNNGFINVYSEPGQGTTFTIYLPRYAGKAWQMQKDGQAEPLERGSETILLVEDESAILEMVASMLEMHGYTVLAANTPGEAIRLAREHAGEIHMLMTDVVMPEMNGRDLAKNLLSLYPDLKRLFMSGYTADVIAHHGVLDDGVQFIQKPFTIKELAVKVRETLEK
ncbi:MAG: PAS domain S-box protein [Desulfobacteraceae bacterium]|nr:MAG: PAS domain S-box protein [Desulfobacteraceae bacterium]